MGVFDFFRKHKKKSIAGGLLAGILVYKTLLDKITEQEEIIQDRIVELEQQRQKQRPNQRKVPNQGKASGAKAPTPTPTWSQAIKQIEELAREEAKLRSLNERIQKHIVELRRKPVDMSFDGIMQSIRVDYEILISMGRYYELFEAILERIPDPKLPLPEHVKEYLPEEITDFEVRIFISRHLQNLENNQDEVSISNITDNFQKFYYKQLDIRTETQRLLKNMQKEQKEIMKEIERAGYIDRENLEKLHEYGEHLEEDIEEVESCIQKLKETINQANKLK